VIEGESDIEYGTPQGQYLAVCAWLSIKEVGLLLGSLVNAVPVPSPNQKEVTTPLAAPLGAHNWSKKWKTLTRWCRW
jgi:hypothetical protein